MNCILEIRISSLDVICSQQMENKNHYISESKGHVLVPFYGVSSERACRRDRAEGCVFSV